MGRRATPESDADIAAYLEAALEDGDPALVAAALGDIARAKGMSEVARQTGLGRESLYKALSPDGNPEFASPFFSRPQLPNSKSQYEDCERIVELGK